MKEVEVRDEFKLKEAEEAFKEGQHFYQKSQLDNAITAFQRAVALLPDTGRYHSHLGRAYLMKGWKSMAQLSFKQAMELNPKDPILKQHYQPETPAKSGLFQGMLGKLKKH